MPISSPLDADKFRLPLGSGTLTAALDLDDTPDDGYYVASNFNTEHDLGNGPTYHLGEDWNGEGGGDSDLGDPIYVIANGVVLEVVDDQDSATSGFGNYVVVRHDLASPIVIDGQGVTQIYSLYAHLQTSAYGADQANSINVGDAIAIGEQIGAIGRSGFAQTAHLHFEVALNGTLPTSDDGYNQGGAPVGEWTDPSKFIESANSQLVSENGVAETEGFSPAKIGSELLVNTVTFDAQSQPEITGIGNERFAVAWLDQSDSAYLNWKVQVFDSDGGRIGSEITVNDSSQGTYIVGGHRHRGPSISSIDDTKFIVSWNDARDIFAQFFDVDGEKIGTNFRVTTESPHTNPIVNGLTNGNAIFIWSELGSLEEQGVFGRIFNSNGEPLGEKYRIASETGFSFQSISRFADGKLIVVWEQSINPLALGADAEEIVAQILNVDGSLKGSPISFRSSHYENNDSPVVTAIGEDHFVVVWKAYDDRVVGDPSFPVDYRAQIFDADGNTINEDFSIAVLTGSFAAIPSVSALGASHFIVTWDAGDDNDDFIDHEVKAGIFNIEGNQVSDTFLVDARGEFSQVDPAIASINDTRFVIAWTDFDSSNQENVTDVRAQIFTADLYVTENGSTQAVLNLASLDGTNGFRIDGVDAEDWSGDEVAGAGDVNGDGFDDLIIGSPFADPDGKDGAGESYVVFGSDGGFTASLDLASLNGSNGFRLDGVDPIDKSGWSVAGAGDVNGDGFDDLIIASVGDIYANFPSESYVVFGADTGFAASLDLSSLDGSNGFRLDGVGGTAHSGSVSVAGAGDVNGDGLDDLIIGAATTAPDGGEIRTGASYVVFGTDTGFAASFDLSSLNGSNGFRLDGVDHADNSGVSVAGAGDVNGDGFDDLIIGANGGDPDGRNRAGESYLVFGSDTGFTSSLDLSSLDGNNGFRLAGVNVGDESGMSVAGAGDVNGDGYDDLIVGAWYTDGIGKTDVGASYVVFGSGGGFGANFDLSSLDGANGFRLVGIDTDDTSGTSVAGAGDVNGDGFDDLIIGAYGADPEGKDGAGESYVVFGSGDGFAANVDLSSLDGVKGFRLNGAQSGDASGLSVAGAGDVNGDGFDDIIIGARRADVDGKLDAGGSYVVFGRSGLGGNNNDWTITPTSVNVNEASGNSNFTLTRLDANIAETVYVSTVQDQGFLNQDDYTGLANEQFFFDVGVESVNVSLGIEDDSLVEGDETFRLVVQESSSDPVNISLVSTTFTIVDNDNALPVLEGTVWELDAIDAQGNLFDGDLVFETELRSSSLSTLYGYFDWVANGDTPFRVEFDAELGLDGVFDFTSTTLTTPVDGVIAANYEGEFSSDFKTITGTTYGDGIIPGTWSASRDPGINSPPEVVATNLSISSGSVVQLSSIFSWSDPDGFSDVVEFAVQDSDIGGGYLTENGIRLTDGELHDNVPISQIADWAFVAGETGSVDNVAFNAIDAAGAFSTPSAIASVTATETPLLPDSLLLEYFARQVAYGDGPLVNEGDIIPSQHFASGWKLEKIFHTDDGLFRAVALTKPGFQPVLAIRGTVFEDISDWISNTSVLGVGGEELREAWSVEPNGIKEWLAKNPGTSVTGHSQGGAQAQMIAYLSAAVEEPIQLGQLVTFNTPGINEGNTGFYNTDTDLSATLNVSDVTHYISAGDIVSQVGNHFVTGEVIYYDLNQTDSILWLFRDAHIGHWAQEKLYSMDFLFKVYDTQEVRISEAGPSIEELSRDDFSHFIEYPNIDSDYDEFADNALPILQFLKSARFTIEATSPLFNFVANVLPTISLDFLDNRYETEVARTTALADILKLIKGIVEGTKIISGVVKVAGNTVYVTGDEALEYASWLAAPIVSIGSFFQDATATGFEKFLTTSSDFLNLVGDRFSLDNPIEVIQGSNSESTSAIVVDAISTDSFLSSSVGGSIFILDGGIETVRMSGGKNVIFGFPDGIDGTHVLEGFGITDTIFIGGVLLDQSDLSSRKGSAILSLDTDDNGVPDIEITLAGNFRLESFIVEASSSGTFIRYLGNDVPVGLDDGSFLVSGEFVTDEDSAFSTGNVLANDTDSDGDDLSVTTINTNGTLGIVTDNGDGTFDYNPNSAFDFLDFGESAEDEFVYTVSDGNGGVDSAIVTITIKGVADQIEINQILGSDKSDWLVGTKDSDAIISGAGSYDRMTGGDGADEFVFGAETRNGMRERDVILDYEVGVDSIVLMDGASVASIRQASSSVVVFMDGDRDAIYVRGDGVTDENLTIFTDSEFDFV